MGKGNKSCNLAFIWASSSEARYFLDALDISINESFRINNIKLVNIISGAGSRNASLSCDKVIKEYGPEVIISAGSCASLIENTIAGKIVISSRIFDLTENMLYSPDNLMKNKELSLSGNIVITTKKMRRQLFDERECVSFDWESGAIAKKCCDQKIRFNSIRAVTDTGEKNFKIEYKENLHFAMKRLSRFLCRMIRRYNT